MILVALPERQVGIAVRKVLPELGKTMADSMPPPVGTAAQYYGRLPSRRKAFSSAPESSVLCSQDIPSLQQQCFLIQFCWATKCNGHNYVGLSASS